VRYVCEDLVAESPADGEVEHQVGVAGVAVAVDHLAVLWSGGHMQLERRPRLRPGCRVERHDAQLEADTGAGQSLRGPRVREQRLLGGAQRPVDHDEHVDVASVGAPAAQQQRAVGIDPGQRVTEDPARRRGQRAEVACR
jgi:hypothetical protein